MTPLEEAAALLAQAANGPIAHAAERQPDLILLRRAVVRLCDAVRDLERENAELRRRPVFDYRMLGDGR